MLAKIVIPEIGKPETAGKVEIKVEKTAVNIIDAEELLHVEEFEAQLEVKLDDLIDGTRAGVETGEQRQGFAHRQQRIQLA